MRRTSFARMQCSIGRSLEAIGDWWTPLILRDLYVGLERFDDLAEDLGISRNLLATRLAHLVDHGLVTRERYSDHPPRHRYRLSEAGRDLVPVLMALTAWGDRWATPDGGPPVHFEHATCGARFTPQVSCSHCGEVVHPDDVRLLAGPGGRVGPGTRVIGRLIEAR
jgi:DNA-binding HxlR family transcriptional regulator